ncbi:Ldh family oxidoreductase [Candidatus Saccharibacteria bacterium]|nr:Ldh family oxidoreductase [Candidatus Saccharibacteria bacterium]
MKVSLEELKNKMLSALEAKGFRGAEADFLVDMYLGGELRGHTSHGLASFAGFVSQDWSNLDKPKVLKETNAMFMIDAKSNPGAIVGKRAADEAIARAKKEGVGTAVVKNMDSWLRPGAIAQYIAEQGFVALVVNDGGGTSTAPPGGYDPVLATNPIAYGMPTADQPLVVDMATSKRAWGQVRLANKYGTDLPEDTFYNDNGEVTLDPKQAHSVKPFGGHKGFALALFIEMLCGSIVGMDNMMVDTKGVGSSFGARLEDRGGFIFVIDPDQTAGDYDYRTANSDVIERIKATSALPGQSIRIPGQEAGRLQKQREDEGEIEISDELWEEIPSL